MEKEHYTEFHDETYGGSDIAEYEISGVLPLDEIEALNETIGTFTRNVGSLSGAGLGELYGWDILSYLD
jgi:hypothetical protein